MWLANNHFPYKSNFIDKKALKIIFKIIDSNLTLTRKPKPPILDVTWILRENLYSHFSPSLESASLVYSFSLRHSLYVTAPWSYPECVSFLFFLIAIWKCEDSYCILPWKTILRSLDCFSLTGLQIHHLPWSFPSGLSPVWLLFFSTGTARTKHDTLAIIRSEQSNKEGIALLVPDLRLISMV